MMTGQDAHFLRLAIKLARTACKGGCDPFGAVLVRDADATVVAQGYDRSVQVSDPTAHAELAVIRKYCREAQIFTLEGYTLYASAEPCIMCSGAIHWARISRVVFSVSQQKLQQLSGGQPKPSCTSLVNVGRHPVAVVGPLLEDEGLAVFEGYAWLPKVNRHAALFGRELA